MTDHWETYDPRWLVELAAQDEEALAECPWLPEALARCTRCLRESEAYIAFVSNSKPNERGSEWQFETNIILDDPTHGDVVLDILKDQRVGGIEFPGRVSSVG